MHNKLLTFLVAIGLTASSAAMAGTIEVAVRYRDGSPIVDQRIQLIPLSAFRKAVREGWVPGPYAKIETTDQEGRATFSNVNPGTFTVGVFGPPRDPLLIKPAHNPLAPAPIVTLDNKGDHRRIELEVWSGVAIGLEIAGLDDLPRDGFNAVFRDPETGVRVQSISFREPFFEHRLAPTVWEVSVEARAGFELVSLEHDGDMLESGTARLDLEREPWKARLRWTFTTSPITPKKVAAVENHASDDAPLQVEVRVAGARYAESVVEIYPLADRSELVRSSTATDQRNARFVDLPAGDYLVVTGSRNHLEVHSELLAFNPEAEARTMEIQLPHGAAIHLQALDEGERPIVDLDVEIERLGDDPETLLLDESFREAKRRRAGSVNHSGWFEATGFYPGRYLVRTRLRRSRAADTRIFLGLAGGELKPMSELEVELGTEPVEIEVRVLPVQDLTRVKPDGLRLSPVTPVTSSAVPLPHVSGLWPYS